MGTYKRRIVISEQQALASHSDSSEKIHPLFPPYVRAVIVAGSVLLLISLWRFRGSDMKPGFFILALVTITIASRIVVQFPGFRSTVSASDTLIFLTLLLYGGESAIILGAVEAYCSSLRVTRKPLIRAFNSASQVCSTFLTVWILRAGFGAIPNLSRGQYSSKIIIATCTMALVQYLSNSGLVAVAGALRANLPILDTWKKYYIYTCISYFAGASAAGIIARLVGSLGFYAVVATLPIIAIVHLTYSTYRKNVEGSKAQAQQAESHLAELKQSEERFRSAFGYAPIGMALVTPSGQWLQVNASLCQILGYSEPELLGIPFPAITHPDDLSALMSEVHRVLDGNAISAQIEKRYVHRLGRHVWALLGISLIRDSQGRPMHLIFQIQDITDRKRAEEQLLHDALHDSLTGLPNRAWCIEQLKELLESARGRQNQAFAVLFLDLDRFKVINDSLGHSIGDRLLIKISDRLRSCLRPGDGLARLGGDEFTVLLGDVKPDGGAEEISERILKQLEQPFNLEGHEVYTSASIGIAFSNIRYECPEDLLRDADTAMYQAKSSGRSRYAIFDNGMHARAVSLLKLETDLRRAVEKREFFLVYQPVISLQDGSLQGFEALLRWRHPERGVIHPGEFIKVAEETGFIVPIGYWVLGEACSQMRQWQDLFSAGSPLSVSVNISARQFTYSGLIDQIIQTLEVTGLDPRRLKLEITESVVMENIDVATRMLDRLRALGVELSIDDFGTGYSSLSYLHRLPIDTLKIDRSFINLIGENTENTEIVRTIVLLAQNVGMGVVAEGIETQKQLRLLRELGCESGQGFMFSRPIEAASVEQHMLAGSGWPAWNSLLDEVPQEGDNGPLVDRYCM